MNEPATPQRPVSITWHCRDNHAGTHTRLDGDEIIVPMCRGCREKGNKRACASGTLEYGDAPSAVDAPPHAKQATRLIDSELWTQFTALLDAGRVRMAGGGGWTDRFCTRCEDLPHRGPHACQCVCHSAWAFRRAIEHAAQAA